MMKKYYPNATDDEKFGILMDFTSFPFGTPAEIHEQIKHLLEVGPGVVNQEIEEDMKNAATIGSEYH
jgi:hypothetical protein